MRCRIGHCEGFSRFAVQVAAGDDEELQGVLQKHLLRSAGAEAVDALLRFHVRCIALSSGTAGDTQVR